MYTYLTIGTSRNLNDSNVSISIGSKTWKDLDILKSWISDYYDGMEEDGVYQKITEEPGDYSRIYFVENFVYSVSYTYYNRIGNKHKKDYVYIIEMES